MASDGPRILRGLSVLSVPSAVLSFLPPTNAPRPRGRSAKPRVSRSARRLGYRSRVPPATVPAIDVEETSTMKRSILLSLAGLTLVAACTDTLTRPTDVVVEPDGQ